MTVGAKGITGLDQYSGSTRFVTWEVVNGHVLLTVEGSESNGTVLLTPTQVISMCTHLLRSANEADVNGSVVGLGGGHVT